MRNGGGSSRLKNIDLVRVHGGKVLRLRLAGKLGVILDLVKNEVIYMQLRARSQKHVDSINRAVIIGGAQTASASAHQKQKALFVNRREV